MSAVTLALKTILQNTRPIIHTHTHTHYRPVNYLKKKKKKKERGQVRPKRLKRELKADGQRIRRDKSSFSSLSNCKKI